MESYNLVIFGITSNLAQLKLLPTLYDMEAKNLLPEGMKIIGIARSSKSDDYLQIYLGETIGKKKQIEKEVFDRLLSRFAYIDGDIEDPELYRKLAESLLSDKYSENNILFYLATYPDLYEKVFKNLKDANLNTTEQGWVRIMVEKPLGSDLESARSLNKLFRKYFDENQIYRLDHYLGKETLQNMLTFRFGNGIFEPLINRDYVDHIQITMAEDFGIERRGGYYDSYGALKDVGQNHALQMLAFATMDAPAELSNAEVTKQRLKILQSLIPSPDSLVLGQYDGYRQEYNVGTESNTDTFFAFKSGLNNDRFKDMPIYIRGGKMLPISTTEIAIVFKNPINRLFSHLESGKEPNVLIYRIQPNEGIVLKILAKQPGHTNELEPSYMQFCYKHNPTLTYLPDPYERLLVDALRGDQTFFNDASEIEAQWGFVDKLLSLKPKTKVYKPGTWGPKESFEIIEKEGREWIDPNPAFCNI